MRTVFVFFLLCIPFWGMYANDPVHNFIEADPLKSASVGILLVNSTRQDTVVRYHSNKSFIPASLMKVVTTSTALETLEPNFKFGTKIYLSARPAMNGELHGKLIINAAGDPTWASKYFEVSPENVFEVIAGMLRQQNVNKILGGIEIKCDIFDEQVIPPGWIWEDMGNYYAPGTYSMAWRDNMFDIHLSSEKPGSLVKVLKTDPEIPGLKLTSYVYAAHNKKDSAYVYGAPYSYDQFISGSIPAFEKDFVIKASLPNPGELFLYELSNYLNEHGIPVSSTAISSGALPENAKLIKAIFSPPLQDIVTVTNKESVNLYAEYLLKHISLKLSHTANREKGIQIENDFWRKHQVNVKGIRIQDGSGLSPKNLLTPDFLVGVLDYMRTKSHNAQYFVGSLPIATKDGTLKGFAKNTNLEGRIFAKTGSMNGIQGYAGYIHAPSGDIYTFCVMINHHQGSYSEIANLVEKLLVQTVQ